MPIFSHRYPAADPRYEPSPVFSVYQTDVIYYGDNLVDYVAREFMTPSLSERPERPERPERQRVPFWSDLAEGIDISEI